MCIYILHLQVFLGFVKVELVDGVLLKELGEIGNRAARLEVNRGLTLTGGEELQGRVATDSKSIELRGLVRGHVNSDNINSVDVLELGGELLKDRGKLLAVTAPRGVELGKDILLAIEDQFLKGLGDNLEDIVLLGGRDILRLLVPM